VNVGIKVALSVAVVLGGVIYMIATTVGSGDALEYYKQVDEVLAEPGRWQGKRLQVHGNVVSGSILKRKGSLDFRFAIHKNGKWLDVSYTGLVPDAFKDCAELVIKGKLGPDQTFNADTLSAKCPSKYEGKLRKVGCGDELLAAVLQRRGGG
jgi:cytochrome c-type biogenesis protein CcmE